jgi:hypothetical protein
MQKARIAAPVSYVFRVARFLSGQTLPANEEVHIADFDRKVTPCTHDDEVSARAELIEPIVSST